MKSSTPILQLSASVKVWSLLFPLLFSTWYCWVVFLAINQISLGFCLFVSFPPPPSFLLHPHPPNPFQCWKQNNLKWKTCDLPSLYLQCHKPQGKDLAKLSSCNGKGREKLALVFAAVIFNTSQQSRMGRGRRIRSLQSWVKRSQSHR